MLPAAGAPGACRRAVFVVEKVAGKDPPHPEHP